MLWLSPRHKKFLAFSLLLLAIAGWWSFHPSSTPQQPRESLQNAGKREKTDRLPPDLTLQSAPISQIAQNAPRHTQDRFPQAEVLDSRESPIFEKPGHFLRSRLLRTHKKYPYLRVDEEILRKKDEDTVIRQDAYVADHVIFKPRPEVTEEKVTSTLRHLGAKVLDKKHTSGIWLVSFPTPALDTVPTALAEISKNPDLAFYSEVDGMIQGSTTPNDPAYAGQRSLNNTGGFESKEDADIDAPEAWDLCTGSRSVLVAVCDTGIYDPHEDLAANIWHNPNEIPGNNIDDDHNGYIDDVSGWNFVSGISSAGDDSGHGTHCAGTIGAIGNNGKGISGVNWQVSLVPIKMMDANADGVVSDAVEATCYATSLGVHITSASWEKPGFSQALKDAIDQQGAAGIVFVAAAGNDAINTDVTPIAPACYTSPNIISVAATTRNDGLADFSNFGATSIDIAAPGVDINSTVPPYGGGVNNVGIAFPPSYYTTLNGTSMSAPYVTGVCALLKAYQPEISAARIKELILQSADKLPALSGKCVSGGRLNAYNALLLADDLMLTPGTNLRVQGESGSLPTNRSLTYTLANNSPDTMTWTAQASQTWISLSPASGTVAPGTSTTFTVSLTSAIDALAAGSYSGQFTITNTKRNRTQSRPVELVIMPPVLLSETMDTAPAWQFQGGWTYGIPTGGGGIYSAGKDPVAGATGSKVLGVNLAGDYAATPGTWYATAGPYNLRVEEQVWVEYQRWLNHADQSSASFELSTDGTTWTTLWQGNGLLTDTSWKLQRFNISTLADLKPQVWFRWGYKVSTTSPHWVAAGWNVDDFKIRSRKTKHLSMTLPASLTEGAGATSIRLNIYPAPAASMKITLSASNGQATVPASVTVPAGQSYVNFNLTPTNDSAADGSQPVTITASVTGYVSAVESTVIHDNETRTITLTTPATFAEGDGLTNPTGTITLNQNAGAAVAIRLTSSMPDSMRLPETVIIPSGTKTVSFPITIIDNNVINGTRTVTITASVTNWTGASKTVTITDEELRNLTLGQLPSAVSEGAGTVTGKVSLSGTTPSDLVVTLSSSDSTEISSGQVTIPAGASSVIFTLPVVNESSFDGSQQVTLTATATTFTSSQGIITVMDDDVHHLTISTIGATQQEGKAFDITVTAKDVNNLAIAAPAPGELHLSTSGDGGSVPVDPATIAALTSGSWTGRVRVMQAGQNIRLTAQHFAATAISNAFEVTAGPRLVASPTALQVSVGQTVSVARTITLANQGLTTLTWSMAAQGDIQNTVIAPASGSIPAGSTTQVQVQIPSGSKSQGVYNGMLNIASNDLRQPSTLLPVEMTVIPRVDYFAWDAISSPQPVNVPFPVRIRAMTGSSQAFGFTGTAALSLTNGTTYNEQTIGSTINTTSSFYPLTQYKKGVRTQILYQSSEVGIARQLTHLGFLIGRIGAGGTNEGSYTIRLKHSDTAFYTSESRFESSGWTTVFSGQKSLSTSWNYFQFTTPFDYDGVRPLMVDISYKSPSQDGNSYQTEGKSISGTITTLCYTGDQESDPLLWDEDNPVYTLAWRPVIRLSSAVQPTPFSPAVAADFVNGVWSGNIVVEETGYIRITAITEGSAASPSPDFQVTANGDLSVVLPTTLWEGQGISTNAGKLQLRQAQVTGLTVTLTSSAPSRLSVPATIVIPAGQTTVDFDLTVLENPNVEPASTVTVKAAAASFSTGQSTTTILDNDAVTLPQYAFGIGQGDSAAAQKMPSSQMTVDEGTGKRYLTYQFRRLIQHGDMIYQVQTSSDLSTWDTTGTTVENRGAIATGDGTTETVSVRIPANGEEETQKFVRLMIKFK